MHYHPTKWTRREDGGLTGKTCRDMRKAFPYPQNANAAALNAYRRDYANAKPCDCENGEKAVDSQAFR